MDEKEYKVIDNIGLIIEFVDCNLIFIYNCFFFRFNKNKLYGKFYGNYIFVNNMKVILK